MLRYTFVAATTSFTCPVSRHTSRRFPRVGRDIALIHLIPKEALISSLVRKLRLLMDIALRIRGTDLTCPSPLYTHSPMSTGDVAIYILPPSGTAGWRLYCAEPVQRYENVFISESADGTFDAKNEQTAMRYKTPRADLSEVLKEFLTSKRATTDMIRAANFRGPSPYIITARSTFPTIVSRATSEPPLIFR